MTQFLGFHLTDAFPEAKSLTATNLQASLELKHTNPADILTRDSLYTVNHKKRDILFLTITLANLNRFFMVHCVYAAFL